MKKIVFILSALVSTAAFANNYANVAIDYTKKAQFALAQCPKGGCGTNQLDIMRDACAMLMIARSAAMQSGDKDLYQITRDNVRNVCGPNR